MTLIADIKKKKGQGENSSSMKSNGDMKESSVYIFHGTASMNHGEAGHTTAMLASSQPLADSSSEFGCINIGDAISLLHSLIPIRRWKHHKSFVRRAIIALKVLLPNQN